MPIFWKMVMVWDMRIIVRDWHTSRAVPWRIVSWRDFFTSLSTDRYQIRWHWSVINQNPSPILPKVYLIGENIYYRERDDIFCILNPDFLLSLLLLVTIYIRRSLNTVIKTDNRKLYTVGYTQLIFHKPHQIICDVMIQFISFKSQLVFHKTEQLPNISTASKTVITFFFQVCNSGWISSILWFFPTLFCKKKKL